MESLVKVKSDVEKLYTKIFKKKKSKIIVFNCIRVIFFSSTQYTVSVIFKKKNHQKQVKKFIQL